MTFTLAGARYFVIVISRTRILPHLPRYLNHLTSVEEKFRLSRLEDPSGDEDVLGNGVLFDARKNTLENPESAEVFYEMFQTKRMTCKNELVPSTPATTRPPSLLTISK